MTTRTTSRTCRGTCSGWRSSPTATAAARTSPGWTCACGRTAAKVGPRSPLPARARDGVTRAVTAGTGRAALGLAGHDPSSPRPGTEPRVGTARGWCAVVAAAPSARAGSRTRGSAPAFLSPSRVSEHLRAAGVSAPQGTRTSSVASVRAEVHCAHEAVAGQLRVCPPGSRAAVRTPTPAEPGPPFLTGTSSWLCSDSGQRPGDR